MKTSIYNFSRIYRCSDRRRFTAREARALKKGEERKWMKDVGVAGGMRSRSGSPAVANWSDWPPGQFIANKWVTLVRRRISPEFIVYYSVGSLSLPLSISRARARDDIGPYLLAVALMSLIAPPPVRSYELRRQPSARRRRAAEVAKPTERAARFFLSAPLLSQLYMRAP